MHATARSISRPVQERLLGQAFTARVLAVFYQVCDLVTPAGDVVALVTPHIGDGPLNVVVDAGPGCFATVEPDMVARLEAGAQHAAPLLCIGGLEVALEDAAVWEPRPDWNALRARRAGVGRDAIPSYGIGRDAIPSYAAESLRAGWEGDLVALREGAARLAGLGGGLTPTGDDFLTGVMLWAWLTHPDPPIICRAIVEEAAPRTTTLSAAFLRAAADGQCSAAWHRLLAALRTGTEDELAAAVQGVLAYGATSGADALAGFLWIGIESRRPPD